MTSFLVQHSQYKNAFTVHSLSKFLDIFDLFSLSLSCTVMRQRLTELFALKRVNELGEILSPEVYRAFFGNFQFWLWGVFSGYGSTATFVATLYGIVIRLHVSRNCGEDTYGINIDFSPNRTGEGVKHFSNPSGTENGKNVILANIRNEPWILARAKFLLPLLGDLKVNFPSVIRFTRQDGTPFWIPDTSIVGNIYVFNSLGYSQLSRLIYKFLVCFDRSTEIEITRPYESPRRRTSELWGGGFFSDMCRICPRGSVKEEDRKETEPTADGRPDRSGGLDGDVGDNSESLRDELDVEQ
jgi:hypothetical protein